MRVLHINTEKGWRGGEWQTLLTLRGMRAKGICVELYSSAGSQLAEIAMSDGFVVHTGLGFFPLILWLLCFARRFSVVHAHNARSATDLALYRCFGRVRAIFTRRTDTIGGYKSWFRALKWRQFDALACVSEAAAAEPRRLGIVPVVIRSAVPATPTNWVRIDALRAKYNLEGKTLIGTAAVFTPDKDPMTCVRAAEAVCKVRSDVAFLHWGSGGALEEQAKKYVADANLSTKYIFLGFISNPEELYASLSVFVLTSKAEALGTCVLDAMTQRIPVVATEVGGLKETLMDNRGLLAPAEDAKAISEKILWILEHPSEAIDMANRAYSFIRREHDPEGMIDQYINLYQRLVSH